MSNAEDTPPDGFARVTGPLPRRHPGDNRPDWSAPGEAEALANDEALRYSPRPPVTRPPWDAASEPSRQPAPPPAAPPPGGPPVAWGPGGPPVARPPEGASRRPGSRPAAARPGESAPRSAGPGPASARSGESAPRSPGPRPATVRSGQPMPRAPRGTRETGLRPPAAPPVAVAGRTASRDARPPRHAGAAALAQVPYVVVLVVVVAGLWWAWRGSHDVGNGAGVVGGALLAAAIARLTLPQGAVGLLASRRRFADVLALGTFGAGLLVLALVLPPT